MKNLKRNISRSFHDGCQYRNIKTQDKILLKSFYKLFLCSLVLSISYNAMGQTNDYTNSNEKDTLSKKIQFSPRLGITYANHKEKSDIGTSDSKRKAILGFMAGVAIHKPINEHLSVESGIFLAQKGSKSDSEGFSDGEEYYEYSDVLKMLYIDVPLLVRYTLFEKNEGGLAFYGGVQPSFLLNAKRTNKTANTEDKETVTKLFKKFDAAASIGVGYLFENGISLHISYDHGFININKSSDFDGSNYFKTYNRVLKFSVGYQLGNN